MISEYRAGATGVYARAAFGTNRTFTTELRRSMCMKNSKILVVLAVAFLIVALPNVAVSQDKATAQEVVAKVKEAASALSKTGDLAQFNQKQGPWVSKETYMFIQDCDKKVIVAHPIKPEIIGQD